MALVIGVSGPMMPLPSQMPGASGMNFHIVCHPSLNPAVLPAGRAACLLYRMCDSGACAEQSHNWNLFPHFLSFRLPHLSHIGPPSTRAHALGLEGNRTAPMPMPARYRMPRRGTSLRLLEMRIAAMRN